MISLEESEEIYRTLSFIASFPLTIRINVPQKPGRFLFYLTSCIDLHVSIPQKSLIVFKLNLLPWSSHQSAGFVQSFVLTICIWTLHLNIRSCTLELASFGIVGFLRLLRGKRWTWNSKRKQKRDLDTDVVHEYMRGIERRNETRKAPRVSSSQEMAEGIEDELVWILLYYHRGGL